MSVHSSLDRFPHAKVAKLQPSTAEKFMTHWKKVSSAFHMMDVDRNGQISADELSATLKKLSIGLNTDEFKELWDIFDSDRSGYIDYKEFQTVLAEILEGNLKKSEYKETNGVSLNIPGPCSISAPKTRSHLKINTSWNNQYRQSLDKCGDPMIAAMVRGDWYFENPEARYQELAEEKGAKAFFPADKLQQWDKDTNMPEMSAIILGKYYGNPHKRNVTSAGEIKARRKWITTNIATPRNYGDWLHHVVHKSLALNLAGITGASNTASSSPRTKRTRATTAPATTSRRPIRALPPDEVSELRKERAREFIESRSGRPTPRTVVGGGGNSDAASNLSQQAQFTPRPPNSARANHGNDVCIQDLQKSTYRCAWAAPKAETLQRAWLASPRAANFTSSNANTPRSAVVPKPPAQ